MLSEISVANAGAMAQENRLDVIMNNLANVNTVGFRKDFLTFKSVFASKLADSKGFGAIVPEIDTMGFDTKAGNYEHTGNTFDMAIDGKGFFMLRDLVSGKISYTRAGNFRTALGGKLLSADGNFEVLSASKAPIVLALNEASEVSVDDRGMISVDKNPVAAIGVADFEDYSKMSKLGGSLFDSGGQEAKILEAPKIRSEFVEGSTVNTIEEMSQMVETLRAIESNLQIVKSQDSVLDRTVNDLGRMT